MRRAETFWQALVLFLVFMVVVGIYTMLALAWRRLGEGQPTIVSPAPTQTSEVVQILAPLDGGILKSSAPAAVRAAATESGFARAELYVDGVKVAAEVNPNPQAVPWVVQWVWDGIGEGSHALLVRAKSTRGEWAISAPVTVVVVPRGHLFFASDREGAYAVYSMQTDGSGLTRLTTGPGNAHQPVSRGEGVLAFVAETGAGQTMIRQMEVGREGVADVVIGRDPAWSPLGVGLAYAAGVEGTSQVFIFGLDQGGSSKLTSEGRYAGQPTWSPDGRQLAYVVEREGNWDIWAMDPESGDAWRLTDDPAMDWAPAWSPDGSRLAFVSNRGGSHQIYEMRADGAEVKPLTNFVQGAELPRWSPDGFWLTFVAYTGQGAGIKARELYLMRADGQDQVRLTRNAFDDTEPDWARQP
jgi:dipeptidyl aminopeptidase/acylaminoacyl peptidase